MDKVALKLFGVLAFLMVIGAVGYELNKDRGVVIEKIKYNPLTIPSFPPSTAMAALQFTYEDPSRVGPLTQCYGINIRVNEKMPRKAAISRLRELGEQLCSIMPCKVCTPLLINIFEENK